MQEKVAFLTGGTGYVGCHLAYDLLQDGYTVVALVRPRGDETPLERVCAAVTAVDENNPPDLSRLIAVAGEVQDTAEDIAQRLRNETTLPVTEIWHCVATFKFTEQAREQIEATNIEGVRHMLDLVRGVNGDGQPRPRYFHVSTAYSSGREAGRVPEAFERHGNEFRSLYEWSKHEGEALVSAYQQEYGLDATIFRPAIIIGSPETNVVSYSAYYQVCEALYRLRKRVAEQGAQFDGNMGLRIVAAPETRVNFVPIDFVTQGMRLISAVDALENESLKVFNIINETPPTLESIYHNVCYSLDIEGLSLVEPSDFEAEPPNRLERVLARSVAFQAPYMCEELAFEMANFRRYVSFEMLPSPEIDSHFLQAINQHFFAHLQAQNAQPVL